MTTIAYKDGLIAYDSRRTQGSVIAHDDFDKLIESRGVRFFLTGSVCDFKSFIECYFGASGASDISAGGFVVDGDELIEVGYCSDTGIWKLTMDKSVHAAAGSGAAYALTAMDMGASAEKAVEMAIKRDIYSGGAVRVYSL